MNVTTLEQEVDLLSALGIWEVDELEMQKQKVSNTNKQLWSLKKTDRKHLIKWIFQERTPGTEQAHENTTHVGFVIQDSLQTMFWKCVYMQKMHPGEG